MKSFTFEKREVLKDSADVNLLKSDGNWLNFSAKLSSFHLIFPKSIGIEKCRYQEVSRADTDSSGIGGIEYRPTLVLSSRYDKQERSVLVGAVDLLHTARLREYRS